MKTLKKPAILIQKTYLTKMVAILIPYMNIKAKLQGTIGRFFVPVMDRIVPKDDKIIIFSGNGLRGINGNVESLLRHWPRFKQNRRYNGFVLSLKNERFVGVQTISPLSLNGTLTLLRSRTCVISHGPSDLFWSSLAKNPKRRIINVWHGTPIKKIGSWEGWNTTSLIAASETEKEILAIATGVPKEKIVITGFPRTDKLINENNRLREMALKKLNLKENNKKWVLYSPTFRKEKGHNYYLHRLPDFSKEQLFSLLDSHNANLLIRAHINDPFEDFPKGPNVFFANFKLFPNIEPLYSLSDLQITDYSSGVFEYLLLNKPVLGIAPDYDEYSKETGFLLNYKALFPGPIVSSWKEARNEISKLLKDSTYYKPKREKIKRKFNLYRDGKSSERCLRIICKHN